MWYFDSDFCGISLPLFAALPLPSVFVENTKSLKSCFNMRITILPASPRRVSSRSYEVRCVPVSDDEHYTKSNGFSGKIMGVSSRWFSISLRPLRSLRRKPLKETGHLVNVRGRTTNDKGQTMRDREIMVAVNTGSQTARGGSCCHARRRRRRSRRSCSASRQSGQSPSPCRPLQMSTSRQ